VFLFPALWTINLKENLLHTGLRSEDAENYYRLIQAYLDINDHTNAKKILDIINHSGSDEQKAKVTEIVRIYG
jgi:predicted solute-binding protein